MLEALDYLTCFVPNSSGSSLDKYTEYSVTSAKLYVTVFLYHVPDPDTLFSDSDIMQSASNNMIQSTDVRYFPFDLYTLEEDKEVASENLLLLLRMLLTVMEMSLIKRLLMLLLLMIQVKRL